MTKAINLICFLGVILVTTADIHAQEKHFPELTGPYLGRKPPGMTPEVFAPGIVSKEGDQGRLFIAGDGSEIIHWVSAAILSSVRTGQRSGFTRGRTRSR